MQVKQMLFPMMSMALTMASSHQKYLIKNDFINYFLH